MAEENTGFGFQDLKKDNQLFLIYERTLSINEEIGLLHAKLDQIAERLGMTQKQQQQQSQQEKEIKQQVAKEEAEDSIAEII